MKNDYFNTLSKHSQKSANQQKSLLNEFEKVYQTDTTPKRIGAHLAKPQL
jgi:hypothetical protein